MILGAFWDPVSIKTVKKIANELSQKFNAPEEVIIEDTKVMLQQLADKGFIVE